MDRPYQHKNQDLVPVPQYHFGETTNLSIATRLLEYTHAVLNRLLEWHLLVWEASGKYEPTKEIEMHTERIKKVTAGDRVFLPGPRQFIRNMGVLGSREQQGENRGGIPKNHRSDSTS